MAPRTPPMDCEVITNVFPTAHLHKYHDPARPRKSKEATGHELVKPAGLGYRSGFDLALPSPSDGIAPVSKAPARASKQKSHIYIGIGGWTFAPWRGVFYPDKLPQSKELEYA